MPTSSESAEHQRLKRLALVWAQAHGFPIAAAEVSVPNLRCRLDVAGYRPGKAAARVSMAKVGLSAIFECKVSRPDYLRDSRSLQVTTARLAVLASRKQRHEETLKIHYPSIRNGDSLFPEYETFEFERPGYEPYQRVLREIGKLTTHLHSNTKFDRLCRWRAAQLCYLVAEPQLFALHELPADWGLLLRAGDDLTLVRRPVLQQVDEPQRLALLHRIAIAATRAVNRQHEISFEHIDRLRRFEPKLMEPARDETSGK